MKRTLLTVVLVGLLGLATAAVPASAGTSVGISVRIGDPYRGAYLHFVSAPQVVCVPATRVYVVEDYDYDLYRYADDWYYWDDDFWYCAPSWRGPFVRVAYATVPYQVRYVYGQGGYAHYWGPRPIDRVRYRSYSDRVHYRSYGDRDRYRSYGDRDRYRSYGGGYGDRYQRDRNVSDRNQSWRGGSRVQGTREWRGTGDLRSKGESWKSGNKGEHGNRGKAWGRRGGHGNGNGNGRGR